MDGLFNWLQEMIEDEVLHLSKVVVIYLYFYYFKTIHII